MITRKLIYLFLSVTALPAYAVEVGKADWIDAMTTALPTAFCNSGQYFRQCFKVSAQQCEETAASATRICINKFRSEIPEVLQQPKDGTYWGTKIGSCAGVGYEAALRKLQIKNEKCSNADYWR